MRRGAHASAALLSAAVLGALAASCESAPPMQPENDGWDLTDTSRPLPLLRQESPDEGWICEGWVEQDGWSITSGTTCYCDTGYTFDYEGDSGCVEQEEGCIGDNCEEEPPDDPGDPEDPEEEETPGDPSGDPDGDDDAPQDTITVSLECDSPVVRGSTMTCALATNPSNVTLTNISWSASVQDLVPGPTKTGGTQWSGVVVQNQTVVKASYELGGEAMDEDVVISVTPRSWSWDTSRRSFAQGSPGDLDNCITSEIGLTADLHGCTAANPGVLVNPGPNQGFKISPATGPNAGLWFVTNPTTRMDLRTQVAKRYRTDGTTYPVNGVSQVVQACTSAYQPNPVPPQNNHGVNTTCFQVADFTNLVSFAWNHEGQHLSAAQQEAQQPANDLYGKWEPIVATDSVSAFYDATDAQNNMHDRVANASLSVHTGASTSFSIWYHTGSGYWQLSSVTVQH